MNALSIKNICKSFGKITALKDINLEVKEGEIVAILGESGCGKSTLVRAIFTKFMSQNLKVIQVAPHDTFIIPMLIDSIRKESFKCILFCDDLSFEGDDMSYSRA